MTDGIQPPQQNLFLYLYLIHYTSRSPPFNWHPSYLYLRRWCSILGSMIRHYCQYIMLMGYTLKQRFNMISTQTFRSHLLTHLSCLLHINAKYNFFKNKGYDFLYQALVVFGIYIQKFTPCFFYYC